MNIQLLEGTWVHSHEESTQDRIVLRSPDYDFPPSRGRRAITFNMDGEVTLYAPGPDDRPTESIGEWSIKEKRLSISGPIWPGEYEVEYLDHEKMIISK